ncbi:MAG: hypothetical protein FJ399_24580 [Verrucomicrobia bacterium]|nr:hypothetical protein [Verrucomicrobiota bacterium]
MAAEFHLKFAVVEAARALLHESPFLPFQLRLHDGSVLEIANPDVLSVTKAGVITYDDGRVMRTLNPALIASVDQPSGHS